MEKIIKIVEEALTDYRFLDLCPAQDVRDILLDILILAQSELSEQLALAP